MAGHFGLRITSLREVSVAPLREHLRAQMKVTKAKGLTRLERFASARRFGRRYAVQLDALRVRHEEQMNLLFTPAALAVSVARILDNRVFSPGRAGQIVFRPFALVTFIWASK
jgi:hypothetical protein